MEIHETWKRSHIFWRNETWKPWNHGDIL
jgi:hypothetical protein